MVYFPHRLLFTNASTLRYQISSWHFLTSVKPVRVSMNCPFPFVRDQALLMCFTGTKHVAHFPPSWASKS